jgi:uncharacterized protein
MDLAKMGRTDWRSVALTILLIKFLTILFDMSSLLVLDSPIFPGHQILHVPSADKLFVYDAGEAAAYVFGLWLSCKKIMRRPFWSLISTNMTFHIRRCLLGAALYLPAFALSLLALSLFFSMRAGTWVVPIRHFQWPQHNEQIVASVGMLIIIPFLAFAEELCFRAWLTQTLGHYIRSTLIVVTLVAVLFAAYHSQYDLREKMVMMLTSLGFSALSLRDQRLELAIGAHSMLNVCATLQSTFFAGALPHGLIPPTTLDWSIIIVLKGALPCALMYGVLRKARRGFAPTDVRLTSSSDFQPRHL